MNDLAAANLDPDRRQVAPTPRTGEGLAHYRMYVGGAFVEPASGAYFDSEDPVEGMAWARIPRGNAADADRAVEAAHRAFTTGAWPALSASRRGALLRKLGDLIADNAEWL